MPVAEETLLTELRVVSLRGAPPYVDVIEGTTVTASVYRPDPGARTLVWTCTPGGELDCAEAGTAAQPTPLASIATLGDGDEVAHAVVPPASRPGAAGPPPGVGDGEGITVEEPITAGPPALVWALSCDPGVCPLFAAYEAAPAPGTPAWQEVVAQLADPFTLLEGLPKVGTAATFRTLDTLLVVGGAVGPTNPEITGPPAPLIVRGGETLSLRFQISGTESAVTAWPAGTAGGFELASVEAESGVVELVYVARDGQVEENPALPSGTVVDVYVAFEAEDGGSALWRGAVVVAD